MLLKTFHVKCKQGSVDISECEDNTMIEMMIRSNKISLDKSEFEEVCRLQFQLDLVDDE